ncbi:MAG TPA: STAS domain-containing protein [Anaeromyxobacter sp.]|nr:STAS domain-containing protein [Anaeromyxobacter sp.]
MSGHAAEVEFVPSADRKVIRVDGVFDVSAAQRLARELADAGDAEVRIDLTRVREFHDFGIALLARELSGRVRITVSGLRRHHIRLLRYLGIEAAAPAEPAEPA